MMLLYENFHAVRDSSLINPNFGKLYLFKVSAIFSHTPLLCVDPLFALQGFALATSLHMITPKSLIQNISKLKKKNEKKKKKAIIYNYITNFFFL